MKIPQGPSFVLKMKKRLIVQSCILLIVIAIFSLSVSAWARHDQMTEEILEDVDWLEGFSAVTVTEYSYDDSSISETELRYFSESQEELGPDEFYYHALYEPVKFFEGAEIGSQMSAKQILVEFSDEPDWELDQNLELSWLQKFHGESQGYRHMYYPSWTFHLPLVFFPQGKTPERVEHFYGLSKDAFDRGDTYWGFRFLARAMHYVQDMAQPYHTRQLYWRFISLRSPYDGTVQMIKNYHFAYESYIANLLRLEQQGAEPERFVSAIRSGTVIDVDNPADLVKQIARMSHKDSCKAMKTSVDFFGEKYLSTEEIIMSSEEFFALIHQDAAASRAFYDCAEESMALAGTATRSFLEFARKDLDLEEHDV